MGKTKSGKGTRRLTMLGDFPAQLDEIDKWLADTFGIIPGACSSIENLRHTTARMVAELLWSKPIENTKHQTSTFVTAHCVESCNPSSDNPNKPLHMITLLYEDNDNITHIVAGDNVEICMFKK